MGPDGSQGDKMRLVHRVRQLERVRALAGPPTARDRFQRALDEASVRLTGKRAEQISGDAAALDVVFAELRQSYIGQLTDTDLEILLAEFERIAFGGDAEARAAAEREAIASLDADPRSADSNTRMTL